MSVKWWPVNTLSTVWGYGHFVINTVVGRDGSFGCVIEDTPGRPDSPTRRCWILYEKQWLITVKNNNLVFLKHYCWVYVACVGKLWSTKASYAKIKDLSWGPLAVDMQGARTTDMTNSITICYLWGYSLDAENLEQVLETALRPVTFLLRWSYHQRQWNGRRYWIIQMRAATTSSWDCLMTMIHEAWLLVYTRAESMIPRWNGKMYVFVR